MVVAFFERFLYRRESLFEHLLFLLLAPIGWINCCLSLLTTRASKQNDFGIKIVGVGNLVVGGTGKTPLTIHLAKDYSNCAVVLRGYKRTSRGVVVVSNGGEILENVSVSGDEAMVYATLLPHHTVIVSENRAQGILKAKELGCKVVFLDDAFRHRYIKKYDILIRPVIEPSSDLCLPASAYRQSKKLYKKADLIVKEGEDYSRKVELLNPTEKMVLVTSIANPTRLERFLPSDLVAKYHFLDHHMFTKDEIEKIVQTHSATSLVVTTKDAVKLASFGFELSILKLDLMVDERLSKTVREFVES